MRYSLVTSVEPVAEPLSLGETKLHLKRDDITTDDALIEGLIQAAREWAENHCRRSFVRRTLVLRMDCFPAEIRLPRGPVSAVSSIEYVAAGGSTTTLSASSYQTDLHSVPARIQPVFGGTWPVPKSGELNAVVVTYLAGYAPGSSSPTDHAENVPEAIKSALKLHVQAHYGRGAESFDTLIKAAKSLLSPFEIRDYALE